MSETITRRELAAAIEYDIDALRKSEARLGLKMCREKHPSREVHYNRQAAVRILVALGFKVKREATRIL